MSEQRQRIVAILTAEPMRTSRSIAIEVGSSRSYVQFIRQRSGFSNVCGEKFSNVRPPHGPTYASGNPHDFDVDWIGRLIYRGPTTAQETSL